MTRIYSMNSLWIHYSLCTCCFFNSFLGQNCAVWDGFMRWALVPGHWTGHWEAQTLTSSLVLPLVVAEGLLFSCTQMCTNSFNGQQLKKTPSLPCEIRSGLHSILSLCILSLKILCHPLVADSTVARCVWASLLAAPGPCRNDWPPRLCNLPKNMSINMSCLLRRLFPWSWVFLFILYWLKVNP